MALMERLHNIKKYSKMFKYLIVDEVYSDFYDKFSLLKSNLKNVIIIKSLSKSLGFAGLRVGFCCASKSIIKKIQTCRMSQVTSSFALSCFARNYKFNSSSNI